MKRKLIKQGAGGLTICLPKKWTEQHHLQPGNEINIEEEQGKLYITTEHKNHQLKQEIVIDSHSYHFLRRLITNAYKKGIDKLKLVFNKEIPLETINEALSSLTIGYEVTDVGKGYCLIQSFSSEEEENIAVSVRKCFFLVKDMQSIILEDLKNKRWDQKDKINALNDNVRKLSNYAIRTTSKMIKDKDITSYHLLIFSNLYLYSIKLTYIYQYCLQEKRINRPTLKLVQELFQLFECMYEAYYRKELRYIHQALEIKEQLVKDLDKNIDDGNGKILLPISMAMRCVHDSIGALMGLIMR